MSTWLEALPLWASQCSRGGDHAVQIYHVAFRVSEINGAVPPWKSGGIHNPVNGKFGLLEPGIFLVHVCYLKLQHNALVNAGLHGARNRFVQAFLLVKRKDSSLQRKLKIIQKIQITRSKKWQKLIEILQLEGNN